MHFLTPRGDIKFFIPDDWWEFSEVANGDFSAGGGYYPPAVSNFILAELKDIAPPERVTEGLSFRKYKLIPVLFALAVASPECTLPLVEVSDMDVGAPYKYRVVNGYHRYYASVAVGYSKLPIVIK
jgi:hypothetical protein